MGKGPYGDIPDENMVFNYNSSHNITFRGCYDSGVTIEEWNDMTGDERREVEIELFWSLDLIDFWMDEEASDY